MAINNVNKLTNKYSLILGFGLGAGLMAYNAANLKKFCACKPPKPRLVGLNKGFALLTI